MLIKIKKEIEFDVKFLEVKAKVRYWEDAIVNDVVDTEGKLIPCRQDDFWNPIIEIETGKIINWEIGKTADIHYKICDEGFYKLLDINKNVIIDIKKYVPDVLSINDAGYGNYIILSIDKNGEIQGWEFDINNFVNKDCDD